MRHKKKRHSFLWGCLNRQDMKEQQMAKGMRRGGIGAPIFNMSSGEDEANTWNIYSDQGFNRYFMKQEAKFCKSCKKRRRYFSCAAAGFHKQELDPTTNTKCCKWWAQIFDSVLTEEISKTPTFSPHVSQVIPMSGPIRGSTTVTMCGRNFGFDKTESFKTSLVSVEVAGAPCKLPRQDYVNKCVLVFVGFPAVVGGRMISGCASIPVLLKVWSTFLWMRHINTNILKKRYVRYDK